MASVGYKATTASGRSPRRAFAGTSRRPVQLAIPIYQGGAIESRVRQAVAAQEKARQDLETARRVVAQSTWQAFSV
ncbi:MAG: TolC family protein [Burkholderiales bacterium]